MTEEEKKQTPLTPGADEQVLVFAAGVHIFIGVTRAKTHVERKEGFWLREAYNISFTNTMIPPKVQGAAPKLANNISILPPPAANLDTSVTTRQLWVGRVAWCYEPTDKAVELVRKALAQNTLTNA